MSLSNTVIEWVAPLTNEQEIELDNLLNRSVSLLKDSILLSYSPNLEKELLQFIKKMKNDCMHGELEFNDGLEVADNLYNWIKSIIELDSATADYYSQQLYKYSSNNKLYKGCSLLTLLSGLGAAGVGTFIFTFVRKIFHGDDDQNIIKPALAISAISFIGGALSEFFFIEMIDQMESVKFSNHFHSFFRQMNPTLGNNQFAKNYYQLAAKISGAIEAKKNSDELIIIIRQNMQNMKDEKVIKNDISEETFVRRLLDTHVTVFGELDKKTLRDFLKDNYMLEEIRETLISQIREITSDELEEEAIRQDIHLNLV